MFPRALRFFLVAAILVWTAVFWHPFVYAILVGIVVALISALGKLSPEERAARADRRRNRAYYNPRRFQ